MLRTPPRVVLVHGSVTGGKRTWRRQRALRSRFELLVVERPGFPPNPPVDAVDYEEHARVLAEAVREGDHLVGHSYGGVIALLTAELRADALASLTVVEPPAMSVARDVPEVDAFVRAAERWWLHGPTDDPEAFLRGFLASVGSSYDPPSPLPADLEQGARALIRERWPWEARIPLDALRAAPFPKLVVSGGHHAAFDAVCDVLEQRLAAERAVLPGHGHSAQRHPAFNDLLADFVERATQSSPPLPPAA